MIAIIDYGIGNVTAISNMLKRLGFKSEITKDSRIIDSAEKIILPGIGSFDSCMKNLRESNILTLLEKKVLVDEIPLLGICVGAQMLGKFSEEGEEKGLSWIDMTSRKFPKTGLPVPHMGWNTTTKSKEHFLTKDIDGKSRFYFAHSYFMEPMDPNHVILSTKYGVNFCSGVQRKNITGVQFHPEKSHRFGKFFLKSFATGFQKDA